MDIYTMSEISYKNDYEAGVKALAKRLKKEAFCLDDGLVVVDVDDIDILVDILVKEMS